MSARLLEAAGAPAIATTSAGVAWSLGYADGERLAVSDLVGACERICRVVRVPVSADIERGLAQTPEGVAEVVGALLDAGVVGVNIEDGAVPGTGKLRDPSVLAGKIAALRALARKRGRDLFINARTDAYFLPTNDPAARFEDALQRARAYVAAGADGIFMPGMEDLGEIARMAAAVERPLNVYAGYDGIPAVSELKRAGVRRVSLGCGPLQAALDLVRRIATEALERGTYAAMTAGMVEAREMNALFLRA